MGNTDMVVFLIAGLIFLGTAANLIVILTK